MAGRTTMEPLAWLSAVACGGWAGGTTERWQVRLRNVADGLVGEVRKREKQWF